MTAQRTNDSMLFLRLPGPLLSAITGAAARSGLSRSEVVRRILLAGLDHRHTPGRGSIRERMSSLLTFRGHALPDVDRPDSLTPF